MTTFRELASKNPFGPNGRVRLGFAIDTGFVSAGKLKDIFAEVRAEGVHLITSHATRIAMLGKICCPRRPPHNTCFVLTADIV